IINYRDHAKIESFDRDCSIQENYQEAEGEDLLNATIEENVLTQIENLKTYPSVHAKLYRGLINIHAWVYKIETGGVYVYSAERCNIQAEHEEESQDPESLNISPLLETQTV
ncbi:carbonic anhydrase, partial [Coleofasciculus sp.]|uniref:carbonic anhydrase n=1 Tax=Coleofasciculus sp. TaxID=3100458 RepID=UPI003A3BB526